MQLHLDRLSKSFGAQRVLDGISLDVPKAQGLALIGPSGGGKSTLLRLLAGLEYPDAASGPVTLNGQPIPYQNEETLRRHRQSVGTVFQGFNLFPHLTALENVRLPLLHVHRQADAKATAGAQEALARFGLAEHANKRPAELSGGQRQRVAIARALAIRPKLLFFDEPTSALDPEMTAEVLEAIEELKAAGQDFVLVTHQMGFARHVADQVALLAGGTIAEFGPPEQVFGAPRAEVTQRFLARVLKY